MAVFVRCADGALHRDPLFLFAEGMVTYTGDGRPELVLWTEDGRPPTNPHEVLARAFSCEVDGRGAELGALRNCRDEKRPIPGADPPAPIPCRVWRFSCNVRPPVPTLSAGTERYPGRLRGLGHVVDLPPTAGDLSRIKIVEKPSS